MTAAIHLFSDLIWTEVAHQCKEAYEHRSGDVCLWSKRLSQDMHVVMPPPSGRDFICLRSLVQWHGEEARP